MLKRVNLRQVNRMHWTAFWAAIFVSILVSTILSFLPLILLGKQWETAQRKARARRLAEAKMNARLLRLNL